MRPSPQLLVALLPLAVLVMALDAYCLVGLARAKSARGAPKLVWALIILFVNAPIGPLLYLFLGRDRDGSPDYPAVLGDPGPAPRQIQPGRDGHATRSGSSAPPAARAPMVTARGLTRDYGGTGLSTSTWSCRTAPSTASSG